MRLVRIATSLSLLGALVASAGAQTLDAVPVATGLDMPTHVGAPDGDSRLFILEKEGRIKILEDGAVLPTLFLNITGPVVTSGTSLNDERGLYSIAFHPDFASNGFFYLCYNAAGNVSRVSRFSVSADPNVADPLSEQILLTQAQPFSNHNGGMIAFGPDGYLYIGFGDGGSASDPSCNAQNPMTFLGKMLRIDVDSAAPYAIPSDNPFVGNPNVLDEIWFLGLRNPWRWSFDRATGEMYIGDVGQNAREEVSYAPAGASGLNFGWKVMEGFGCFSTSACIAPPACMSAALTDPIRQRTHGEGWFSLTGGYVYRGCSMPSLAGTYFYGDFVNNQIWSFEYDGGTGTLSNEVNRTGDLAPGGGFSIVNPSSFGEDGFGELYVCDLGTSAQNNTGEVYKIVPASFVSDCDGDLVEDACQLAANPDLDLDGNGQLDVCQGFSADTGAVSAAAQSAQTWFLHAGAAEGGLPYLVAGSLNGTSPGFNLPAGTVPLNPDFYFNLTITMPNTPPLVSSFGLLDAQGNATGAFDLASAPLPPGLIGQSAYHAYATLAFGTASFISNFIEVRFEP